jgi:S1-C subfamily serine protease
LFFSAAAVTLSHPAVVHGCEVLFLMRRFFFVTAVAFTLCGYWRWLDLSIHAADPNNEADYRAAICSIVYSLDETSAERGYRYIFYGDAFFIDADGYLLTAAHVLSDFHDGAQPQILLRLPEAPPRLVKIEVVATDAEHDIAVLRAVPNPFQGKYQVAFLPLSATNPARGAAVIAAALRPARLKDPHTFDAPQQDESVADVLQYTSLALDKGQPKAELFLFSHEVLRGQSGAPILSRATHEVVGIVEGQWLHGILRPSPMSPGERGATLGAGVPITYALTLLERKHVAWQASSGPAK